MTPASPRRSSRLSRLLFAATALALSTARAAPPDSAPPLAIEPMSTVAPDGSGYLADPNHVHLAPALAARTMVFSGTTKAILQCALPVSPGCFASKPVAVDAGTLRPQIVVARASITNFQNIDVHQADDGTWHAVVCIGVRNDAHPDHWTVLVHAHPRDGESPDTPPLAWSADTVLSGSFTDPVDGNYDGKYFEDEGRLYLLYVKNFVPRPALRNGIVIQPMVSPTQRADEGPVTLLTTGDRYGELDSEWYAHTKSKLVEAPYIAKIGGKYALIYSTGAYREADYKVGVAWSDRLMPANGRYRKVLQADSQGVWGTTGHPEVRYLLQSQQPRWPHFTAARVISPGVASAVRSPDDTWALYFAGFDPADRPMIGPGVAAPDHRRPFFVKLRTAVPADRSVASVSDVELATWLEPEVR